MKLIYGNEKVDAEILINESDNEKKYIIRGIFSTMNKENRNKRKYSKKIWEPEVNSYQKVMSDGDINALMEWKHPPRSSVDPMEAVARMNELYIKGEYIYGEAVLLDNAKANQLKTLIDNGIKISVSSRGLGAVGRNGEVTKYKLITYDIVPDPSDYNATMTGVSESVDGHIISEGMLMDVDFNENGTIISETDTKKNVVNEYSVEVNEHLQSKFVDLFNGLNK